MDEMDLRVRVIRQVMTHLLRQHHRLAIRIMVDASSAESSGMKRTEV